MPSKAYIGRSSKEPKGSARQVRSVSRTIATWAHHILSFAVSPTPQGVAVAGGGLGGGIDCLNLHNKYACDARRSVVQGKSVSVRVDLGGRGSIKQTNSRKDEKKEEK